MTAAILPCRAQRGRKNSRDIRYWQNYRERARLRRAPLERQTPSPPRPSTSLPTPDAAAGCTVCVRYSR